MQMQDIAALISKAGAHATEVRFERVCKKGAGLLTKRRVSFVAYADSHVLFTYTSTFNGDSFKETQYFPKGVSKAEIYEALKTLSAVEMVELVELIGQLSTSV